MSSFSPANDRKKLTFDSVASLYEAVRPECPSELLDAVVEYAQLSRSSAIAEVGPGTGQATKYFLERGWSIRAVELGERLAAFCREKFDGSRFTVSNCAFEDWRPEAKFDLLFSVQAFHWIEPGLGLSLVQELLKANATLALIWHLDQSQDTEFYRESNPLHENYLTDNQSRTEKGLSVYVDEYQSAIEATEAFHLSEVKNICWSKAYSADEWIDMRKTFSPDLLLEPAVRASFHKELHSLIESLGGSIQREYRSVALLARRKPDFP